ncbi:MAG: hypothetical protein ACRD34_15535, partial [Bryobacteraceae bacterium]
MSPRRRRVACWKTFGDGFVAHCFGVALAPAAAAASPNQETGERKGDAQGKTGKLASAAACVCHFWISCDGRLRGSSAFHMTDQREHDLLSG